MARKIQARATDHPVVEMAHEVDKMTDRLFRGILRDLGVNQQNAADLLGMSRMQLYRIRKNAAYDAGDLGRKIAIYMRLQKWAEKTWEEENDEVTLENQEGIQIPGVPVKIGRL
jgi:Bacterial regulatory protein, Fis family